MILVDEAIWPWRGRLWAHLASDSAADELHDFAHGIGLPYAIYQGDHYDVDAELREEAISAGATPVGGRELVRALLGSGLRSRGGLGAWQWRVRRRCEAELASDEEALLAALRDGVAADARSSIAAALRLLGPLGRYLEGGQASVEIGLAGRGAEELVALSTDRRVEVRPRLERTPDGQVIHRSCGGRGTYLEVVSIPTRSRSSV